VAGSAARTQTSSLGWNSLHESVLWFGWPRRGGALLLHPLLGLKGEVLGRCFAPSLVAGACVGRIGQSERFLVCVLSDCVDPGLPLSRAGIGLCKEELWAGVCRVWCVVCVPGTKPHPLYGQHPVQYITTAATRGRPHGTAWLPGGNFGGIPALEEGGRGGGRPSLDITDCYKNSSVGEGVVT